MAEDRKEANSELDKAQEKLDSYRGKDPRKFDQLNDAVIDAEKHVSWAKRHRW